MKLLCLFILLIFSSNTWAKYDPCKYLYETYCSNFKSNSSRSAGSSLPSTSSAISFNPSNAADIDGFGVEAIDYKGDYVLSLASGNGEVGAGIATSNPENTFYGNLALETTYNYKNRIKADDKYDSNKYNFTLGFNPFGKKDKNIVKTNIGVMGRYNTETHMVKGGLGIGIELGPINGGATYYGDDYRDHSTGKSYSYNTTLFSAGLKLPLLSLDYNHIYNQPTSYTPSSTIEIYNGTLYFNNYMFTYGHRYEYSNRLKFLFNERVFIQDRRKEAEFMGFQVSVKKQYVFGILRNYYLLREWSFSFSAFF